MPNGGEKKAVVVTGASRGLGREIALAFGETGCRVVVNYLNSRASAEETADKINASGGEAFSFCADVRNATEVDLLLSEVMKRWKRLDLLVNNAGVTKDRLIIRMSDREWDDVMDTNLKAAFICIRAASRIMIRQKRGHIINIASIVGIKGREGQANYSSSKAGLIGLTKATALELGRFNIQVNAVLPGYMDTDMGGSISQKVLTRIRQENCLGRYSNPREVAAFIVHLAGMENVSGQVFNLDSRII